MIGLQMGSNRGATQAGMTAIDILTIKLNTQYIHYSIKERYKFLMSYI